MNTDPIADYLTRVRNAIRANHKVVSIPASNLKKEITKMKTKMNKRQQNNMNLNKQNQ